MATLPRAGASYECKTAITSQGVQSAGHAPAAGLWASEVDTTEQECTEMTSLGIELRDNNLH